MCTMGAMTAGAGATGLRAWLAVRAPAWMTPARKRGVTWALVVGGVFVAGTIGPTPG